MSNSEQYQQEISGNNSLNGVGSSDLKVMKYAEHFDKQQFLIPEQFPDANGDNRNSEESTERSPFDVQYNSLNPLSCGFSQQRHNFPENCDGNDNAHSSLEKTFQQSLDVPCALTTSTAHLKTNFQSVSHGITCQTNLEQMMYCDSAEMNYSSRSSSSAVHNRKALLNSKVTTGSGRKERYMSQLNGELTHHIHNTSSTLQVQPEESHNSYENITATLSSPQVPILSFQCEDVSCHSEMMFDPCKTKAQTLKERKNKSVIKSRLKAKELEALNNFKRNFFMPAMDEYRRNMDANLLWMKEFYEQRQSRSGTLSNAQNIKFEQLKKEMKVYRSMGAGNKRFLFFLKWAIDPDENLILNQLRQTMLLEFKTDSRTFQEESSKEMFERLFDLEKKRS